MSVKSDFTGKKALVVEDDPFMRKSVVEFLVDMGFKVEAAGHYDLAEQLLEAYRFQLLVVDIAIPRWSDEDAEPRLPLGLEIVRAIKQISPDCGVLVWSAYTHFLPDVMTLITNGHTGLAYIPKGSRASTLQEAVCQVMAGGFYVHAGTISAQPFDVERQFLAAMSPDTAEIVQSVAERIPTLSPRQRQVVERYNIHPGIIASELGLSISTIRNYQNAIYGNLELRESSTGAQEMQWGAIIALAVILLRLRRNKMNSL